MVTSCLETRSLDDLREYVTETICEQNQLLHDAFPLTQRALLLGGRPCGIYFCLHGPRAVKFTAIWETERNQVLFYGANGERVAVTQLNCAPQLARAA